MFTSLFLVEIRWLWREQWPFKDFESRQKNSWLNARYILQEMTPRPPDVCFAAAGADFAAAGADFAAAGAFFSRAFKNKCPDFRFDGCIV